MIQGTHNLISFHHVKITYICTCFLHISVPMNPVLFIAIDYDTILNLCTVFLCLWSHFVKIDSCLRDCNRPVDWHPMSRNNYALWIIMNYIIYKAYTVTSHLNTLFSFCLMPLNHYWYTYTCPCVLTSIIHFATVIVFVNLYNHAPHIFSFCYNVLYLWHWYMYICILYCSSRPS